MCVLLVSCVLDCMFGLLFEVIACVLLCFVVDFTFCNFSCADCLCERSVSLHYCVWGCCLCVLLCAGVNVICLSCVC